MTYILNTFSFLIMGILVMWMAAGFGMLESGLVRSKNVATICLKNISLFGIAGILFYLIGYNLMYAGVDGGYIGSFGLWAADDAAALAGDYSGRLLGGLRLVLPDGLLRRGLFGGLRLCRRADQALVVPGSSA